MCVHTHSGYDVSTPKNTIVSETRLSPSPSLMGLAGWQLMWNYHCDVGIGGKGVQLGANLRRRNSLQGTLEVWSKRCPRLPEHAEGKQSGRSPQRTRGTGGGWRPENGGGWLPSKMKLVRLAGSSHHSLARMGTPVGSRLGSGPWLLKYCGNDFPWEQGIESSTVSCEHTHASASFAVGIV